MQALALLALKLSSLDDSGLFALVNAQMLIALGIARSYGTGQSRKFSTGRQSKIYRGVGKRQPAGLISQRKQVRLLSPQPFQASLTAGFFISSYLPYVEDLSKPAGFDVERRFAQLVARLACVLGFFLRSLWIADSRSASFFIREVGLCPALKTVGPFF